MGNTKKDELLSFEVTKLTPEVRFIASLSDGRTVIQDDRPGDRHAWGRLSDWLGINQNVKITCLRLQGPRQFEVVMPAGQRGYFFGNKVYAVHHGPQHNYVGIGYFDGSKVAISWYRRPLFDHAITEDRIESKAGFFLIKAE